MATGTLAMTPAAFMVKPSFLGAFVRMSPWSSLGQWVAACAASDWRTRGGAGLHVQAAQTAHVHVFRPERLFRASREQHVGPA
eukprot:1199215-Alexandrium_andersonii.AAC.1